MSLLDEIFGAAFNGRNFSPEVDVSENYQHWISIEDWRRCKECKKLHGKIWYLDETPVPEPPIHSRCRCVILHMESVKAGTATINGTNGADWTLKYEEVLPDYYITMDELVDLGWRRKKHPNEYAPDKMVTGGIYKNRDGHLPNTPGRIWHEADINYEQGERNRQRIVWSDDGLIFVTYDHYATFHEVV